MIPLLDSDGRSDRQGSTTASVVAVRVNLPLRKSEPFSIHVVLPSDSGGFGLSTWLMPRSSYRAVAERAIWIKQASPFPWFFPSFQDLPLLLLPSIFLPTSSRHHPNSTVLSGVPLTTLVVPITTPVTPTRHYLLTNCRRSTLLSHGTIAAIVCISGSPGGIFSTIMGGHPLNSQRIGS